LTYFPEVLDAILKELRKVQMKNGRMILLDALRRIVTELIGCPLSTLCPSRDINILIPVWDQLWSLIVPLSDLADWHVVLLIYHEH
jgi:hypothetical protein